MSGHAIIKWFDEIAQGDLALVGGKNASLGEMTQNLSNEGIKVPYGFAISTNAYRDFLHDNALEEAIDDILAKLDINNLKELKNASLHIKNLIKSKDFNSENLELIKNAYESLRDNRTDFRVAVRSSASLEDLPSASFAGQQDSFLHVADFEDVKKRIIDVYASLFGERAIAYRAHHGFAHKKVAISVGVQAMVASDEGQSGVIFTIDPESGFRDVMVLNASLGLGEAVVSGAVNPDDFLIHKASLLENRLLIFKKRLGSKLKKLAFSKQQKKIIEIETNIKERENYSIDNKSILELCKYALKIEKHYRCPMDIEWAIDGKTKEIFIVQARPETVHGSGIDKKRDEQRLLKKSTVLCEGRAVGKRIGQGQARIVASPDLATEFAEGDVLVSDMTDPNWEPIMKKASAIVTNRGGRTCHAAIIARELGIAAVVGCNDATKKIREKSAVTVSCAEGDQGFVYDGLLPISSREIVANSEAVHPVPLMLIAAHPSKALTYHSLPHRGIGLARLEFIIAHEIGVHPNALINYKTMPKDIVQSIDLRAKDFSSPVDFYVESLARGIAMLAAVARPYPIIVRLSDFKSNEYEELIGGSLFEAKENNPMLGFRGASRYTAESFRAAFALECTALKRAREDYGFDNIQVMVPFVRTLSEAEGVIKELERNGLSRGHKNLKIIMMCEVPSNVILAKEFLAFFDGFSIGSNDLTQLTLGLDRDSQLIAAAFNECDPAMLFMLERAIAACKAENRYVGICGQGPSDKPELASWLIKQGIDSISLSPDSLLDTLDRLNEHNL